MSKEFDYKKSLKYFGVVLFVLFILVVLLSLLFFAFAFVKPKVEQVLKDIQTQDGNNEKVEVVHEESVIIETIKGSQDSVVSIAVSRLQFSPQTGIVDESSNIGTGFIVDGSGLIVTNQHVVSSDSDYKVITSDGKEYEVVEILRDSVNDLALLKIKAEGLKAIKLGNSDELLVGQLVIAIGTPFGEYSGTATTGIISGLSRSVTTSSSFLGGTSKSYEDVIQTDAAINPGNSGGPLINSKGEVIGVNFATTSGADNISFALPINRVKERIDEYRKHGKFMMPYLGVEYQMITEAVAAQYDDVVAGALVVRVVAQSPASEAGLTRGDIITKIGEHEVTSSLVNIIQKHQVGQEVDVTIFRDGQQKTLKITFKEVD